MVMDANEPAVDAKSGCRLAADELKRRVAEVSDLLEQAAEFQECCDLRRHDQFLQHGGTIYLGQQLGLHRPPQHLLDFLRTRHIPLSFRDHRLISKHDVDIDQALKTPQFYQLWIVLCFNVTAGIGVLGVAKTMITEIFGTTLPDMVDAAYAATYVVMISFFNMVGRFIWASSSDYIGRRNTYWIFFVLGIFLYLSVPFTAQQVSVNPAVIWLVYFYAATMIIFTMYGGGFATIPAYLADIFGTRYVGGIHGRLLTAWSTAGVLGPLAITSLRQNSVNMQVS